MSSFFTNIARAITGRSDAQRDPPAALGATPDTASTGVLNHTPNENLHRLILRTGRSQDSGLAGTASAQFEALCRENEQLRYEQSLYPDRDGQGDRRIVVPSSTSGSAPECGSGDHQSGPRLPTSAVGGHGGFCSDLGVRGNAGNTRGVDLAASGQGLWTTGLLDPNRQRGGVEGDLLQFEPGDSSGGGGGASVGRDVPGETGAMLDIRGGLAQGNTHTTSTSRAFTVYQFCFMTLRSGCPTVLVQLGSSGWWSYPNRILKSFCTTMTFACVL